MTIALMPFQDQIVSGYNTEALHFGIINTVCYLPNFHIVLNKQLNSKHNDL